MGCQELVYTLVSTAQDRQRSLGRGTYAYFIDFKLAYPSTDHSVIFTKLHEKGIQGPICRNIAGLHASMKSHVLHPTPPRAGTTEIPERLLTLNRHRGLKPRLIIDVTAYNRVFWNTTFQAMMATPW